MIKVYQGQFRTTVPIAEMISVKNAQAWVSMISYLKNRNKD